MARSRQLRDPIVTPTHVWHLSDENGLSLIEDDGTARANVFANYWPTDIAFIPETNETEALILTEDGRPIVDGVWVNELSQVVYHVERWNLATRKRIWSVRAPALPPMTGNLLYAMPTGHLTASKKGVFLTRCYTTNGKSFCERNAIDKNTGVFGENQHEAVASITPLFDKFRVDAKDGRVSLQQYHDGPAEQRWWAIFDDEGRVRGGLLAKCARFDEQNRLWLANAQPNSLQTIRALGIEIQDGNQGCVPPIFAPTPLPPGMKPTENGIIDLGNITSVGNRVVWQSEVGERQAVFVDINVKGLPQSVPNLPPNNPDALSLMRSQSAFSWVRKKELMLFDAQLANPRSFTTAGDVFAEVVDDVAVLFEYPPGKNTDSYFVLSVGTIPTGPGPIAWKRIQGTSQHFPSFVPFEDNGKRRLFLAGGGSGLQKIDMASGQLLSQDCKKGVVLGRLCMGQRDVGLAPMKNKKTVWTFREFEQGNDEFRVGYFTEIDMATGKSLRSVKTPRLVFESQRGYRMGWLEQDKRFWFAARYQSELVIAVVSIPENPQAQPTISYLQSQGRSMSVIGHADPAFFAQYRAHGLVDFITTNGDTMLSMGKHDNGVFGLSRDGKFACTERACDAFRCIVGNEVRPATDPACEPLRVSGFSVIEELAKTP